MGHIPLCMECGYPESDSYHSISKISPRHKVMGFHKFVAPPPPPKDFDPTQVPV